MGLTKRQRQIKAEQVIWKLKGERFEVGDLVRVCTPGMSMHDTKARIARIIGGESSRINWYYLEGIDLVAFTERDLRMVWK